MVKGDLKNGRFGEKGHFGGQESGRFRPKTWSLSKNSVGHSVEECFIVYRIELLVYYVIALEGEMRQVFLDFCF